MASKLLKTTGAGIVGMAKDVFRGMAKGAAPGKAFRVSGTNTAKQAIKNVNHYKKAGQNITRVGAKTPIKRKLPNKLTAAGTAKKSRKVLEVSNAQKAGNLLGGGMRDAYTNVTKKDMTIKNAIRAAHSVDGTLDGRLSKAKMAGTFVGASAVGRIATGGGVMKDKNGNTNVIGIPFI